MQFNEKKTTKEISKQWQTNIGAQFITILMIGIRLSELIGKDIQILTVNMYLARM